MCYRQTFTLSCQSMNKLMYTCAYRLELRKWSLEKNSSLHVLTAFENEVNLYISCIIAAATGDRGGNSLMLRFHLDDIRDALIGYDSRRSPVRRATNRRRLPSKVDEPLTLCKCGPGGNQSV